MVGWLTMINGKKNQLGPLGLSVALSRNLFAEVGEKWKIFGISGVFVGTQRTQIHSATAGRAVQIKVRVIT